MRSADYDFSQTIRVLLDLTTDTVALAMDMDDMEPDIKDLVAAVECCLYMNKN